MLVGLYVHFRKWKGLKDDIDHVGYVDTCLLKLLCPSSKQENSLARTH